MQSIRLRLGGWGQRDGVPEPPSKTLQGRLTPTARAGWDQYRKPHRWSATVVLEAIGLGLAEGRRLPKWVSDYAERIARERS